MVDYIYKVLQVTIIYPYMLKISGILQQDLSDFTQISSSLGGSKCSYFQGWLVGSNIQHESITFEVLGRGTLTSEETPNQFWMS